MVGYARTFLDCTGAACASLDGRSTCPNDVGSGKCGVQSPSAEKVDWVELKDRRVAAPFPYLDACDLRES